MQYEVKVGIWGSEEERMGAGEAGMAAAFIEDRELSSCTPYTVHRTLYNPYRPHKYSLLYPTVPSMIIMT